MKKRRVWKDEEGAQSGEQAAPQEVEEDKATIKSFVRNKRTRGRVDTHWGTREQDWTQYRRGEEAELESHSEITNHCESRPVSHFLKRRFIILLFLLQLVLISLSKSPRWHLPTKPANHYYHRTDMKFVKCDSPQCCNVQHPCQPWHQVCQLLFHILISQKIPKESQNPKRIKQNLQSDVLNLP